MTENTREVQLKATMDATGVRAGVEQAKTALGDLSKSAEREGAKAGAGIEKVSDGAERASAKVDREVGRMAQAIQRATAAAEAGGRGTAAYFEAIAKQRGISGDALAPYIAQLRQAEAIQKQATAGLGSMGVSAAQTAAALRQVPAQFTDIATSLAAGQAPLTVFLQQGGQLKDAFGGAGAAARALGGYVLGLVNPFTVSAAAVAALAVAYNQGANESQAFTRALVLSGNQAGMTAVQLQEMARAQSAIVGTQGEAADALAKLAATGRVSALAIEQAAEAVVRFSRVGGSVEDTVKKFERLGKEPLKAVIDLNEAENFLTVAVYKQIKALEEQGRVTEAANVAQQAYAATLNSRTQQIEQNLGSIERGWLNIKDAAKLAWDIMLNVGRQQTVAQLDQQIAALERRARILAQGNAAQKTESILIADQVAALRDQREALSEVEREAKKLAAASQTRNAETKAAIAADKEAEKSAKGVSAELAKQQKLVAELAGLSGDFFEEWARLPKVYKDVEQLTQAQAKLLAKQPAMRDAAKAQADAQKEAAKALDDLMKAEQRRIDAQYKVAEQVGEQIQKLEDEAKAIVVSAAEHISLAAAIERVRVARLEEAAAKATAAQDYAGAAAIRAEIEAREKLAVLLNDKDAREASKKAADDAAKEWKRASDDIERTITDALMRGFESGKGFAQTLRDTLVNTFKTLVLRPTIQAVVQPVANSLTGSLGSLLGLPSAGSSSGSLGSLGSLGNLAFMGGGIGGGLGSLGGEAAMFGTAGADQAFSSTMLQGSTLGSLGSTLGYIGAAVGALNDIKNGKWGSAVGTGVGAFFGGPIGAAVGSAIGKAVDKVFSGGAGTPHMGADYISTATGGYRPGANEVGIFSAGASVNQYRSQAVEDALKVLTGTGAGLLNSLATAFGKQANYAVGGYFAADGRDPAQANTRITAGGQTISSTATRYGVSGAKEGLDAFTAELAGQVRAALASMDIPEWAKTQLDGLANSAGFEELANAVQSITATSAALKELGEVMPQLSGLTGEAVNGLLKALGGIDNLRAAASSYYDNFYSDAEKSARATEQLGAAFSALGLSVPATREAFRALVEAQDLNTESGRAAYAELLKLSPAFGALVPVTQQLGEVADTSAAAVQQAAAKMAEAGRKVLADLAETQGGLQVDLLRAQGKVQEAAALERQQALARLTEGLTAQDAAAAAAAYDFNAALREQIAALNAAASAAEQAAAAEAQRAEAAAQAEAQRAIAVAQERSGLEVQLLQLQGDTVALRARELAGIDASNRALLERIYAIRDEQAAQQEATRAAQEAAQAAQAAAQAEAQRIATISNERSGLETQLLQLQGNTVELRARELAGVDASNRALLERIFALRDEQAAQQEAVRIAQEAAQAAQEAAQAEAQRLATLNQQRSGLEERLLQLQGDTAALRERERAALDESLRPMLDRIFALQDEQAAASAAAQAARDLEAAQQAAADAEARRVQAIASEREGLITRLLQAQGDTAALRARELAALDASNRDILQRIFGLEDERAAQAAAAAASQAAAEAANEAARQAEQLRQAWQSVSDGIFDEVARIRGLGGNGQSLASAQRQFAITTAQARAGDQEAGKLLPGISQTLLQLAEANATSLLDLQRIRAQIAASLEQTGTSLAARFGLSLPKFDVGTNYVPKTMAAIVHEGEAIVPRRFNPAAGGGSAEVVSELRSLRDENKAQALAIVKLQTEISRLLKNWDGQGLPETRVTA